MRSKLALDASEPARPAGTLRPGRTAPVRVPVLLQRARGADLPRRLGALRPHHTRAVPPAPATQASLTQLKAGNTVNQVGFSAGMPVYYCNHIPKGPTKEFESRVKSLSRCLSIPPSHRYAQGLAQGATTEAWSAGANCRTQIGSPITRVPDARFSAGNYVIMKIHEFQCKK